MRKSVKIGLGTVVLLVTGVAIYWRIEARECRRKEQAFEQRLQEVRGKTEELKIGATIGEIDFFFRRNVIQYVIQDAPAFGKVAIGSVGVPMCGSLVCDDNAVISVIVRIDPKGRTASKDVSVRSRCLSVLP